MWFDQRKISDLERDSGLSKRSSDIPASRLNEKNFLDKVAMVSYCRSRDSALGRTFELTVVACIATYSTYIQGLLEEFGDSDLQFN